MDSQFKLNNDLVTITKSSHIDLEKDKADREDLANTYQKDKLQYQKWITKRAIDRKEKLNVAKDVTMPCFVSPIFRYHIENYKQINKDIIDLSYSLKSSDPKGMVRSNHGGWHSDTNFYQNEEVYPLRLILEQVIENVLNESKIDPEIPTPPYAYVPDMWCNINGNGDINNVHSHPGCHYSGCYYVKIPEMKDNIDSGSLVFVDPRVHQNFLKGNDMYCMSTYRITPEEGDILIFRSDMLHYVLPNKSDEDRISIAFNITLQHKTLNG